jgi:methylmalonyl-CoA mutase
MDPIAPEFAPTDEAAWRKLVEKALNGAPWETLVDRTADGAQLKPLYREADFPTAQDVSGAPGAAPFLRGAQARRDPRRPWDVRQIVAHPDRERANAEILADLRGGVSSIELKIDPFGESGVALDSPDELATVLDGVALDLAPVALEAPVRAAWTARLLAEHLGERNLRDAAVGFNLDPIGAFARSGGMHELAVWMAADFAVDQAREFPNATSLRVDARPVHEAGGSEAQELGAALASGVAYMRELAERDLPVDEMARHFLFTLAVGPDTLVEAAKLRALRLCWARVLEASNAKAENRVSRIQAVTSARMMTRYDPYTNILRATAAAFAAAVGGADSISVRPFTDALGLPTPFARRIARNTQLVLMEEAHLGHVIDPAGGAWFVEKLTRELAEAGWAFMQKIETEGGIVEALKRGWLQEEVRALSETRQRDYAMRDLTVTGVTDFPLLGAEPPTIEPPEFRKPEPWPPRTPIRDVKCKALPQIRWAAPFEALREKAERAGAPSVFFATLGALSEFNARSNFARNLFAVGGVAAYEPEAVYEGVAQICADFQVAQTPVAAIVGTDAAYERFAADAARSLKAVGAGWIILAGRPGAREAEWRRAGIDQFVFPGVDVLEALSRVHQALRIA